jgi:hypothetical protein
VMPMPVALVGLTAIASPIGFRSVSVFGAK